MPTIGSQLPVVFKTTGFQFTQAHGYCGGCGSLVEPALMRGLVTRPGSAVACVEAIGACHECKMFTRYLFRVYDDARLLHFDGIGGWNTYTMRPKLWVRILRMIFGS